MKVRIIPPVTEDLLSVIRRHQELIDALAMYFDVFDWTVEKEPDGPDGQLLVLMFPSLMFESTIMRILSSLFPQCRTSVLSAVYQVYAESLDIPQVVDDRIARNTRPRE